MPSFISVSVRKTSLQESQAPETREEVWTKEVLLSVEEDQVREHLNYLDTHTSPGTWQDAPMRAEGAS